MHHIKIIRLIAILSLFSSQIHASSVDAIRQQCFQAFEKGQGKGCPVEQKDVVDQVPEIEAQYMNAAKEAMKGHDLSVYTSKMLSKITFLAVSTVLTTKIAGHFVPSEQGGAAVGLGLIGASAIGNMVSSQVQGVLDQISNPAAKHLFYPIVNTILSKKTAGNAILLAYFAAATSLISFPTFAVVGTSLTFVHVLNDYLPKLIEDELARKADWKPREMLEARLLKFKDLAPTLPQDLKNALFDELKELQKKYSEQEFGGRSSDGAMFVRSETDERERIFAMKRFEKIDRLMNMPRVQKKVIKAEYEPKLKQVLKNYPAYIQDSFETLASTISRNSEETCDSCSPSRSIHFLLGATGTGKTHLVREFADALGLPLIILKLSKDQREFELVGEPRSRWDADKPLGVLTKTLTSLPSDRRYKNAIIFFDEADKALNKDKDSWSGGSSSFNGIKSRELVPFLLDLFNSKPVPLHLYDLQVDLDISKFTFILAGNAPVVTKANEFMARMTTINFEGFDLAKRTNLACHMFGGQMAKYGKVSPDGVEMQTMAEILAEDDDRNLGVRPLITTITAFRQHLEENKKTKIKKTFDWKGVFESNSRNTGDAFSRLSLYKKNIKKKREALPPDAHDHNFFQMLDEEIARFEQSQLLRSFGDEKAEEKAMVELQRIALMSQLPVGIKDLTLDPNLFSKLEAIFDVYPESVKTPVMRILRTHIENSRGGYENNAEVSKNVFYFLGEPGTLKTSLVAEIGRVMELPIIELRLESGKEDFVTFTKPFLSSRKEGNYFENGILLIDEGVRSLNHNSALVAKVMKLIDASPMRKDFELEIETSEGTTHVKIDSSRFLFVLIGNDVVNDVNRANTKNSKNSAFGDRLNLVKFENFTLKNKQALAKSMFLREIEGKKLNLDEETLDRHLKFVDRFAHTLHEKITSDSFRGLEKVIRLYVSECRRAKDLDKLFARFEYEQELLRVYSEN